MLTPSIVGCRGNDRREIYKDDIDWTVFLEKLQSSLEIYGVKLHAYVLMSNHFHLIISKLHTPAPITAGISE